VKLLPLLAALVLAGCGSAQSSEPASEPPAEAPAKPVGPPPKGGPPPAWVETAGGSFWLAYSSYCWERTCVDMLAPDARTDLPRIVVRAGETVRFHLGFRAREAVLRFVASGAAEESVRLDPILLGWRAHRGGVVWLFTRPARAGGDASYVAEFAVS
jgi:hypothetical protein